MTNSKCDCSDNDSCQSLSAQLASNISTIHTIRKVPASFPQLPLYAAVTQQGNFTTVKVSLLFKSAHRSVVRFFLYCFLHMLWLISNHPGFQSLRQKLPKPADQSPVRLLFPSRTDFLARFKPRISFVVTEVQARPVGCRRHIRIVLDSNASTSPRTQFRSCQSSVPVTMRAG
jgi:hypothetical protein